MRGKIRVIIGPMYCGKSTLLMSLIDRYSRKGKKCLLINHTSDKRYHKNINFTAKDPLTDSIVVAHTLQKAPAKGCSSVEEIFENSQSYDVIGIDEGHFFGEVTETLNKLANQGKIIIFVSIPERLSGKGFDVINLIATAETVKRLSAICSCGNKASFTRRIAPFSESYVGGSEAYAAICRNCLIKNKVQYDSNQKI